MLRSYRLIILAIGLILSAAGPPANSNGQRPPEGSSSKGERSLEEIASSLREANKPSDLTRPCRAGDDNRDSDLCAQWKAADAARSAANAAWLFGLLATLVGSATLVAAWAAALWAKKAADHTERGADEASRAADAAETSIGETKRIGEAQVRCYPTATSAEIGHTADGAAMIKVMVKNAGLSPALNVTLEARVTHLINRKTHVASEIMPDSAQFEIDIPAGQEDELITSVTMKIHNDILKLPDEPFHVMVNVIVYIKCKDVFGCEIVQADKFSAFLKDISELGRGWTKLKRDTRIVPESIKSTA